MISNWKEDLLKEKSLREAYVSSKALARSSFNKWAVRGAAVSLAAIGVIWTLQKKSDVSYNAVLQISDTAFDLTVQILGFLIGGFAIFATISDSDLMVRLAKTDMKRTGLSVFKTIFFNFISVFYIYVVTLSIAVIVKLLASLRLFRARDLWVCDENLLISFINSVTFFVLGMAVTLSILRLKSFIWNIYQAYLTLLIAGQLPSDGDSDSAA